MSIVFKPKIAESFRGADPVVVQVKKKPIPRGTSRPWSNKELSKLVELRAIGVSYLDAAKIMKRSQTTVISAVVYHDLYGTIETKRAAHIAKVLYDA